MFGAMKTHYVILLSQTDKLARFLICQTNKASVKWGQVDIHVKELRLELVGRTAQNQYLTNCE